MLLIGRFSTAANRSIIRTLSRKPVDRETKHQVFLRLRIGPIADLDRLSHDGQHDEHWSRERNQPLMYNPWEVGAQCCERESESKEIRPSSLQVLKPLSEFSALFLPLVVERVKRIQPAEMNEAYEVSDYGNEGHEVHLNVEPYCEERVVKLFYDEIHLRHPPYVLIVDKVVGRINDSLVPYRVYYETQAVDWPEPEDMV
mmetsp:Transcript_12639/g.24166  ORF Transcript_12639/g.24166 Transcript_12639/m.24166 type:complete len:200 (+) Transcript_12639:185-784(+)